MTLSASVLAKGFDASAPFAAEQHVAYVIDAGSVLRVPIDGSKPSTCGAIDVSGQDVTALAASAEGLYVCLLNSDLFGGTFHEGSIVLFPSDGGSPHTLASGGAKIASIVVDETSVHWTSPRTKGDKPQNWTLHSAPRETGTTPTATILKSQNLTKVYGTYEGAALVDKGLGPGGILLQRLGRSARAGRTIMPSMRVDDAIVDGDRIVVAGSFFDPSAGGFVSIVALASLSAADDAFHPVVILPDWPDQRIVSVATYQDRLFFLRLGKTHKGERKGELVSVSFAGEHRTVLSRGPFPSSETLRGPQRIFSTARGILTMTADGALRLYP